MKTFELVSVRNEDRFGQRCMDWSLLENGRFRTVEGNDRLQQQILKSIFINKQRWGYGSSIATLKGAKDVEIIGGVGAAMVDDALKALRNFQDEESISHDIVPNDEIIASLSAIGVKNINDVPTKFVISMSIIDGDGNEIEFKTER